MRRLVLGITAPLLFAFSAAEASTHISPSGDTYIPVPVVLVHGMNSAPDAWTTLTEKLQPLLQNGTLTAPATSFRYGLPSATPRLEGMIDDPQDVNGSYFQTAHYGRHKVLEMIPVNPNQTADTPPFLVDPMMITVTVSGS